MHRQNIKHRQVKGQLIAKTFESPTSIKGNGSVIAIECMSCFHQHVMIKPIYLIWVISSYLIQWFSTRPSNQISVLHSVLSESCVSSLLLSDLFHRINPGSLTTNMLWRGCPGWYQLPTTINHILIVVLRHMYVLYIYCMCIFKHIYI